MSEKLHIFKHCLAILVFVWVAVLPFIDNRLRAGWSKSLFLLVAISGILFTTIQLTLHLHWIDPTKESRFITSFAISTLAGFIGGLLIALLLSGQLIGEKTTVTKKE